MNRSHLFSLMNYLSQFITLDPDNESTGCNHTFQHTLAWINSQHFDQEAWLSWLQQRGGWCDCTIVLHIFLNEPHELGEHAAVLPFTAFNLCVREL